jgi:hypothetical protein
MLPHGAVVGHPYLTQPQFGSYSRVLAGVAFGVFAEGSVQVVVVGHGFFEEFSCWRRTLSANLTLMFRKNYLLLALVMSFSASAFALSGGPFDNGDYNQLMDDSGIYQWTAYMNNGLGEGQFASNNNLGATISAGSTTGSQVGNTDIGSALNRCIYYYQGVTYFGSCFGIVDLGRKKISCVTNGSTQVTISTQASASATGTTASSAVTASSTVVQNGGLNFVANSEWSAEVGPTQPILEFHGEGELTIIQPSSQALVASLAQQIISQNQNTTLTQLASLVATLNPITGQPILNPDNLATVAQNAAKEHITVSGSRKYFLTISR